MILILDANAVIPNSELTGVTWAEISAAIDEDVLKLIVPTIVVAEITGRVRANRRSQRPRTDGTHGVPQTVQDAIRAARNEVENWAAGYDAAAVLAAAGAVEWTVPTVGHDVVSQRAIDRLPPFNGNGGGYRDALHWYTGHRVDRPGDLSPDSSASRSRVHRGRNLSPDSGKLGHGAYRR